MHDTVVVVVVVSLDDQVLVSIRWRVTGEQVAWTLRLQGGERS